MTPNQPNPSAMNAGQRFKEIAIQKYPYLSEEDGRKAGVAELSLYHHNKDIDTKRSAFVQGCIFAYNLDRPSPAEQEGVKSKTIAEAVLNASLPKHDSFDTFIFNDKPDKPLGWDESIEFAQANYCSLDPVKDNQRPQMREKAISAWSFQAGAQWSDTKHREQREELIGAIEKIKKHQEKIISPQNVSLSAVWNIANEILTKYSKP